MYYKTITLNLEKMEMNMEMKLTEHFTLEEMCRSETARRQGLPNVPQECHVRKLQNLCRQVLEPTRHHFGVPLRVTSGYRCEAVNRMVGGVPNSQHRQGEAADFVPLKPDGPTLREMTTKNFPLRALERGMDWLRRHVFHITDDCSQIEDILATASQLVRREQVRVLLLDPFNYIDLPVLSGANDTQKISYVLRNIVEFAHRHNVLVILVAHPKKPQEERRKGRMGDMPSLYDIAGSADFYNKCDYGIIVQRSNALTFVHVLKVRFRHLGQLGVRAFTYNTASGRFSGTDEVRSPSSGEVIQYTPLSHDESDWTTEQWTEGSLV